MSDESSNEKKDPTLDVAAASRFVWHMASVVQNTLHNRWLSSYDSDSALKECYSILQNILSTSNSIEFKVVAGVLKVNNHHIELKNSNMESFVAHMDKYSIQNFELLKDITLEQFAAVIAIIISRDEMLREAGGFNMMLEKYGIKNVKSRNVVIREISEEEVVIEREELLRQQLQNENNARAYLAGAITADDEDMIASLKEATGDAPKMAEMIIDAAKESAEGGTGLLTPESVVGCLERAFDALMLDPSMKTPTGQKKLGRALKLIEQELQKMAEGGLSDFSEETMSAISGVIGGMTDDLKVQALASEYMKKRSAIEESEKRILRFIKAVGLDSIEDSKLAQRLSDEGLDIEGWRALLGKSELGEDKSLLGGIMGKMSSMNSVGHLAALLGQLEGGFSSEEPPAQSEEAAQKLHKQVEVVEQEMTKQAVSTKQKIDRVVEDIHADEDIVKEVEEAAVKSGKKIKLSRAKLLEILAEAVQELCQPLAVVNCSLEMMISGALGEVNDPQKDMLKMATDGVEKMTLLADNLMEIAGTPEGLTPDAEIQQSLYK
jgi:hypothetical protein